MKRVLTAALIFGLWTSPASGLTLEGLFKKPVLFWQEGVKEFIEFSQGRLPEARLEITPPGVLRLELFTEIAGSYNLSVKEVEELYERAVKLAVQDALSHLKCTVRDPDIGFVFGDVTGQIKVSCEEDVKRFVEKNSKKYLKQAIQECNLLKLSPTVSSFVESSRCRELLSTFPEVATKILFNYLRKEERELYEKPPKSAGGHLREIVITLKSSGIL
ncbi:hypothetical protein [Thermovibrio sp.]